MSKVEVNTVEPQCGTTLTLGACGDTVALGSGAAQSGFGRTGTVDWVTTVKVTGDSPITGVNGEGYFLNTTAGTITVNLPAGSAGSILAFKDYAGTWDSNAVTITPNGSEKIGGVVGSGTLSTERQSVTLIYIDSTQGWLDIHDSTSDVVAAKYVTATGGTPCAGATSGDYKIHTFTGPGTLVVSCAGNCAGSDTIDYLAVAGGGGGGIGNPGGYCGGAGGAGGFRESVPSPAAWTASPIAASGNARPVTATPYAIVVGGGGAAPGVSTNSGTSGSDSSFSDITSAGGGGGSGSCSSSHAAKTGGSGGGGAGASLPNGAAGNTPSESPAQGFGGGSGPGPPRYNSGGGGGGATELGQDSTQPNTQVGGRGGAGATTCISASPVAYAGGGGGGGGLTLGAASPCGTGGSGAKQAGGCSVASTAGTTNKGGGGGGGQTTSQLAAAGGSGVVIIRYKFQ